MGCGDALRDEVHNDNITPLIGIFDMYSASLAAPTWRRRLRIPFSRIFTCKG
jgi:hypothetical protein